MKSIFAIAKYTIVEQIRNRLYLIIIFFGVALLLASTLLGELAPGEKTRVIFDLGLLALELFGLATAVFGAVTLILQEIESKTIYLLLTRPLNRGHYVVGRFLGLTFAVALTMASMAIFHVLIMVLDKKAFMQFDLEGKFWMVYPVLVLMSMGKMLVITAVALFFSLFATSSVSALVFTGCFWIAGHFGPEMAFLMRQRAAGLSRTALSWVLRVLPDFQYLNFRDTYAIPKFPGYQFIGWAFVYAVSYTAFFLILSTLLFRRKEF